MRVACGSTTLQLPDPPFPNAVGAALARCEAVHRQFELDRQALADAEGKLETAQGVANEALIAQKLGDKADTTTPGKAVATAEQAVAVARANVDAAQEAARRCVASLLEAITASAEGWRQDLERRHASDVGAVREAIATVRDSVERLHGERAAIRWLTRVEGAALRANAHSGYSLTVPLVGGVPTAHLRAVDALDELIADLQAEPEPVAVERDDDVVRV